MKKISAPLFILIALSFITTAGFCQDEKIRIYFGNGVFNDEEQARDGNRALEGLLQSSEMQGDLKDKIVSGVSHNPTDGLLDLFEVAQQTTGDSWSAFWRSLGGLEILPDFLLDEFKNIAVKFDENRIKANPSIQQHVDKYNEDLCRGDKVIVVAHSQGNLYANIAYEGIDEERKESFGIVSVANPSWRVAGDNSNEFYTTIKEDIVIKVIPWALGWNVDNFSGLNPDDLSGHMFVKSYLASGLKTESRILGHIITKIYALEWPEEGSCLGALLLVIFDDDCFVWNLSLGEYAEVALNAGGKAEFPVKVSDVSEWIGAFSNDGECKPVAAVELDNPEAPVFSPSCTSQEVMTYVQNEPPVCCARYDNRSDCSLDQTVRGVTEAATLFAVNTRWESYHEPGSFLYNNESDRFYPFGLMDNSPNKFAAMTINLNSQKAVYGENTYSSYRYSTYEQRMDNDPRYTGVCLATFQGTKGSLETLKDYSFTSPWGEAIEFSLKTEGSSAMIYTGSAGPYTYSYQEAAILDQVSLFEFAVGGVVGDADHAPCMVAWSYWKIQTEAKSGECFNATSPCTITYEDIEITDQINKIEVFYDKTTGDPKDLDPFALPSAPGIAMAIESLLEDNLTKNRCDDVSMYLLYKN